MENAPDNLNDLKIALVYDGAINYAFQQNAIPVVKELRFCNDSTPRKNLVIRITTTGVATAKGCIAAPSPSSTSGGSS